MNDPFEVFDFKDEKDWLSGRMNGIGGSDASAVVGMNPYKSNIDLFEEKTGRRIPEDISGKACVIYGKYAEEPIRELFKLDYPEYKVEHHEFRILRSIEYPFMQASLDGELTDQDAYCSDECAGYASKERARTKMREIQEEHRKFITETRQKKNMKKPGKKSKQYRNELIRIAVEAREHGMSYGQYVGIYEYQKGMKI